MVPLHSVVKQLLMTVRRTRRNAFSVARIVVTRIASAARRMASALAKTANVATKTASALAKMGSAARRMQHVAISTKRKNVASRTRRLAIRSKSTTHKALIQLAPTLLSRASVFSI